MINGKRYYRDDQTGRLTVDNVSQQEADRRMNRTENRSVSRGTAVRSGSMAASQNSRGTVRNAAPARRRSRRIPWGWILAAAVILSVVGAFVYNRSHISAEEQDDFQLYASGVWKRRFRRSFSGKQRYIQCERGRSRGRNPDIFCRRAT